MAESKSLRIAYGEALAELELWLQGHADADAEAIQFEVYEIGKRYGFEPLRSWFQALYEILLGSSQGPRMGTFFALYGVDNSRRLIGDALRPEERLRGDAAEIPAQGAG